MRTSITSESKLSRTYFTPDGHDIAAEFGITLTEVVSNELCAAHLGSDGILYFRYRPDAKEELEDYRKYHVFVHAALHENTEKVGLLVDLTNLASFSREARAAHAKTEALSYFYAVALIVRSPLSRAVGGFFIFLDRPPVPTRMFGSEREAREWLLRMRPAANPVTPRP